jgi:steroid 5-alpha reductase family enzyme
MTNHNRRSLIGITAAVVIGVLVALAGSQGSTEVLGWLPVFALCGLMAYAVNWAAFVPANRAKTERYYDLTGSITYVSVTGIAVMFSDDIDLRAVIVAGMVCVWAIRLGTFLFRRIRREGRDGRFDQIKADPLQFFMTWTLQGLWVFLTLAAALAIITSIERRSLGWWGIAGIAVWSAGFTIEVVADRQKSAFKRDPANAGRFITSGLWAWSRHPNYFGEITLWAGIAVMAIPLLSGWRWVVLISPVFVALLITRVSGVPMLEARADKRWGDEAEYRAYRQNTPVLIPRPPRRSMRSSGS